MNPVQKYLAPMLSRVATLGMIALAAWLAERFGIIIDQETQQHVVEFVVVLALYAIGHRLMSRKTNPSDTAKPSADAAPKDNPLMVPQNPIDSIPKTSAGLHTP